MRFRPFCRPGGSARNGIAALLVTLLAVSTLVCWLSQTLLAQGVSFVWVESWQHPTSEPVEQAAAGDVDGDGSLDIAVLAKDVISVYAAEPEGPRMIGRIRHPAGAISSIAVADYDGDGADEVWAGSAAPGVVAIFGFDGASFQLVDQVRYAWDDIVQLLPLDLDGWGMTDLALLTNSGELQVFRWDGTGYAAEELGEIRRGVRFAAAGDIDSDERDEIVVARDLDHVVVLDWAQGQEDAPGALVRTWENYVWGGHTFLAVGDFRAGPGDEVFLSTSRGLVYVFESGQGGTLVPQGAPQNRLVSTDQVLGTGDLDLDGQMELLVSVDHGIEAWDVAPLRTVVTLRTASQPVEFVHINESNGTMVTAGSWGFTRHDRQGAQYVRVLRHGSTARLKHEPVVTLDTIYLSASDWEALTGARLRWDVGTGRVTGIRGFHFLVGETDGVEWIYDGRPVKLSHPPLVRSGELYLPIQFADLVDLTLLWDPFTRTLLIDP